MHSELTYCICMLGSNGRVFLERILGIDSYAWSYDQTKAWLLTLDDACELVETQPLLCGEIVEVQCVKVAG